MPAQKHNRNTTPLYVISALLIAISALPISAEIIDVEVTWDPEDEPLNIGDVIHFKVTTDGAGSVVVDISTVHQSIQLYDDGTNGDAIAGDHVYELDYIIFENDTIEGGPILAHFIAEDGTEEQTTSEDEITPKITIDGTRPVVTNDGAAPDPFNPYEKVIYIRYILTENSTVAIKIYKDDQLVRRLGTPSGRPGENHTSWNGADDEGNIMPDGLYTYEITAIDRSGNHAIPTRGGCILSTVYIEIDNSLIAPNPFSPNGDDVDDIAWITFDLKLIASEEQLRVLGFGDENLITATPDDDHIINPFALIGISIFDSSGESEKVFSHDLTPNSDSDFAPNGWPNGIMPADVPPGSGNYLGLGGGFLDFSDQEKNNDWDTLVPLNGPFKTDETQYYTATFSLGWEALATPDGTYIVGIECELVGRTWEFDDYMEGPGGVILGEKWHAIPARHHGIRAYPRRKSVTIDREGIIVVDDDPPIITSTTPSGGSVIDPTREKVQEIIVVLDDGAGGSGVDPIETTVSLLDPLLNKLGGQHIPYGMNTVKLALESILDISGTYTIIVEPVDKRGNKPLEPSQYTFIVEDTSAPIVAPNTVQPRPTEMDADGIPIAPYTQPINEISVVLTDGLTGSGVDLENSALYVKDSTDETIEGELSTDQDNKKLLYNLKDPLVISDTYTIVVIATDYAGAKGIYTYQFVLDMAENISVHYEGKTYLMIYAGTEVIGWESRGSAEPEGDIDLSTIAVQETEAYPALLSELSNISEYAIQFQPSGIELSQDADFTMYYQDSELPLGIKEEELTIYAYKTQAKDWVQLPNVSQSEEDNTLSASISVIDGYYIIAYTSPVTPSLVEEVALTPPKYFNPNKEMLVITFTRNMADYKVEVYNTAGDRIVQLKEGARSDKSLGWDGKNQDGTQVRNGIYICRISYNVNGRAESLNKLIAVVK